jgi:FtsZ-binding cell division protein ZapB
MPHIDRRLASMHHALTECADMIAILRKEREELRGQNESLRRVISALAEREAERMRKDDAKLIEDAA